MQPCLCQRSHSSDLLHFTTLDSKEAGHLYNLARVREVARVRAESLHARIELGATHLRRYPEAEPTFVAPLELYAEVTYDHHNHNHSDCLDSVGLDSSREAEEESSLISVPYLRYAYRARVSRTPGSGVSIIHQNNTHNRTPPPPPLTANLAGYIMMFSVVKVIRSKW